MWTAVIDWILAVTQGLGYIGVAVLMTIESSFIPLPSEIVVPPAAYLASQGKMNLLLIIVAGVLGSLIGATINYILARSLGRLVIYKLAGARWAKWFLITPEKLAAAEKYFLDNSRAATFFGRLIPAVRQLISIPAGFCRMPYGRFIAYTALGSTLWVVVLAALGYCVGANQGLLKQYYEEISWSLIIMGALWVVYKIVKNKKKRKTKKIDLDAG